MITCCGASFSSMSFLTSAFTMQDKPFHMVLFLLITLTFPFGVDESLKRSVDFFLFRV